MTRRWWKPYLYGVGAGHHLECCPFCGQTFDIRDLGQVRLHRDHLLAADGPPAIDLTREKHKPPLLHKLVPFRRRREG